MKQVMFYQMIDELSNETDYLLFANKETEAQRDKITCPKSVVIK